MIDVLFRTPEAAALMGGMPDGVVDAYWDASGPLPEAAARVEVFVPAAPITSRDLEAIPMLPALRLVQLCSSGVDHVVEYVPDGVVLCTVADANARYVAEWVVGALIAAQRELPRVLRAQARREWVRRPTSTLIGKTVMVLGYGSIGRALDRQLAGFDVQVVPVAAHERPGVHGPRDVLDLLPSCDAVVVLVPLGPRTAGLVDADFLARMADGALLVCASRGGVVAREPLERELGSGRLRAALDVTDPEPLPASSPLWDAPGTLISPHVAGVTDRLLPEAFAVVRRQLERFVAGAPLENVVDRAAHLLVEDAVTDH